MNARRVSKFISAASVATLLMVSAPVALSHGGYGTGPGYGMGDPAAGTMMGPGGGMMGPGMTGQGMMGPGMMGPGAGGQRQEMHRQWMAHGANLSADQRESIERIRSEFRHQQWDTLGAVMDARDQLYDVLSADEPDPQQVGDAFERLSKLRRQLLEAHVAAHNRMLRVLTDEQRAELGEWQHGAMHQWAYGAGRFGPGYGMMMMMPGM